MTNFNLENRSGTCHTFRKSRYHNNLQFIHTENSFEIVGALTQNELITHFNNFKYFISYDPLTFLSVIAALCGCISIVKKVDGMSKEQWFKNLSISEYITEMKVNTLYGIAYGSDDLENAINTLHLAKQQWNDIINFMINKNVKSFLSDLDNYDQLVNTVKHIYY